MASLTLYPQNVDFGTLLDGHSFWDNVSFSNTYVLGTSKSGAIAYDNAFVPTGTSSACISQFCYTAPTAMTITGWSGAIGIREGDYTVNAYGSLVLYNYTTKSADQFSQPIECLTAATSCGEAWTSLNGVSLNAGDYLVFEVGIEYSTADELPWGRVYRGGTSSTNLVQDGSASSYPSWITLTYTVPTTPIPVFMNHYRNQGIS